MRGNSNSIPTHSLFPDGEKDQMVDEVSSLSEPNSSEYIGEIEDSRCSDPIEQALLSEQEENTKLRAKYTQVSEQNRILVNRLQNAGESVSLQAGESELLIPEISRDLLDNLVRENARLKQQLVALPSTLASSQVEKLNQENDELRKKLRKAESVLSASSDEKDAVINQQAGKIAELLAENQMLSAQCRQLVQQQDEDRSSDLITEDIQKMSLENCNKAVQLKQVKQENNELKAGLQHLRDEFQEVVGTNKQWQMYDKQREEHIKHITAEKHGLQLQLNASLKQVREICNINKSPSNEEHEKINTLKHQLQVYKDDFNQERRDRQAAQSKAAKFEEENSLIREQLRDFQGYHMNELAKRRADTLRSYRDQYIQQHGPQHQNHLLSHGSFGHVVADCPDDEDEDTVDVPMDETSLGNSTSSLPAQQSMLECPKCHQQFPVDDPMQFLDHNDQCSF